MLLLELHWYHILFLALSFPYFLFSIFSIRQLFQLYRKNSQRKQRIFAISKQDERSIQEQENVEAEEVVFLLPKKFNLHILKQFFFWQMIPFYILRFALFQTLGYSQIDLKSATLTISIPLLRWIAVFMCLYIIGSALVHNCYFLTALYWSEHVSYHHGLGLTVVEARMKTSRIIFIIFSILWLIFEMTICVLTIYFVWHLQEACFMYLRWLIHIQFGFDLFLSLCLTIWFIVYSYIRKRSLFNWNTDIDDDKRSDPFFAHVSKLRKQTFVVTIICILFYTCSSLFSVIYFEVYQVVFHPQPLKEYPSDRQRRNLLAFWITKGIIDVFAEILSFSLYLVFSSGEYEDQSSGQSFSFLKRSATFDERSSLMYPSDDYRQ